MNRETVARNQSCTLNREPSCPTNMPKLRIKNEYVNDGNKIGNIVSKPARGWLHPDRQILEEGVCYQVRVNMNSDPRIIL